MIEKSRNNKIKKITKKFENQKIENYIKIEKKK